MSVGIIVKSYDHYNRALGKHISSRAEYAKEMARGGYIPFDKAEKLAEKKRTEMHKPYDKPSEKALNVMRQVQGMGRNGKIKLSDHPRLVREMEKVGVRFDKVPDIEKFKRNSI